jgi:pimeloyl-ACP methyl ester carboxylesterase
VKSLQTTQYGLCVGVYHAIGVAAILILSFSTALSQSRYDTWIPVGPADSLDATYFLPATSPPVMGFPLLVFVHGFGLDKNDEIPNGEVYARMGYATLAISVRGHGNYSCEYTIMGSQYREDFRRVLQFA